MLDIKRLREDADAVRAGLRNKGADAGAVDALLALDAQRRERLTEVESLKSERNAVSKEIGARKKRGEDTDPAQAAMRGLGGRIAALDEEVRAIDERLHAGLLAVPNVPHCVGARGAQRCRQPGRQGTGPTARVRFRAARATSSWAKRSACSTSRARPACPAPGFRSSSGPARGCSAP